MASEKYTLFLASALLESKVNFETTHVASNLNFRLTERTTRRSADDSLTALLEMVAIEWLAKLRDW